MRGYAGPKWQGRVAKTMKGSCFSRMMRLPLTRVLVLWMLSSVAAPALDRWAFRERGYYEPLLAEPRAAALQILFPALSDGFPFAHQPGRHLGWDISVGKEIPMFGMATNSQDPLPPGAFGWGLWVPIGFHMTEDLSKDPSAPILNTDYRFGTMLKGQFGIPAKGRMTESHVGIRFVPWAHESTHIGDEFTLSALDAHPEAFKRVNVSYEYWELGVSFEPNFGQDGLDHFKFRFGYIRLWDQAKGWYNHDLLQPRGGMVAATQDFHFGPGTVTGYTPAAPNTTSFRAEPCTSPPPVGARARPSAHRR